MRLRDPRPFVIRRYCQSKILLGCGESPLKVLTGSLSGVLRLPSCSPYTAYGGDNGRPGGGQSGPVDSIITYQVYDDRHGPMLPQCATERPVSRYNQIFDLAAWA